MARNKAPKPLAEAPPEPDSSDAEPSSDTETEEEPQKNHQNEEEEEEEEEEDVSSSSSGDEEQEEDEKQQTPLKNINKPLPKKPVTESSSEDEEEEDDDSRAKNLKPVASPPKPVSKPRSGARPTVAALPSEKRPLETADDVKGATASSKKPRKEKEKEKAGNPSTGEEGSAKKGVLFQRLYSEDDEIAILKKMIDYREKKGGDPMVDVDDFYLYTKGSLHVEVNRTQFVDKIRRLKKRYVTLSKKKKINNPHESLFFELAKKNWDNGSSNDGGNSNNGGDEKEKEKDKDKEKPSNGVAEGPKSASKGSRAVKGKSVGERIAGVVEEKKAKDEEAAAAGKIVEMEVDFEVGEAVSNEALRKKGLKLMGAKARAEISEMWEKVVVAQREVDSLRFDVQKEENRRILEAIKGAK